MALGTRMHMSARIYKAQGPHTASACNGWQRESVGRVSPVALPH